MEAVRGKYDTPLASAVDGKYTQFPRNAVRRSESTVDEYGRTFIEGQGWIFVGAPHRPGEVDVAAIRPPKCIR